ncbi:(2Fe-2S)-binding protein [Castellaniella caeni]|uniref:(2Fe-2S)-binding protein n=1 Tax=Castellaniella caeni TaxID=266123 RepID=UPI00082D8B41|nr:(2Fe-2S)-binding protein [Castellaniella caeni]
MYICVCNAISERQVQEAIAQGAGDLSDLQAQLGVATCCGQCAETATEYLPGGRYAAEVAATNAAQPQRTVEATLLSSVEVRRVA